MLRAWYSHVKLFFFSHSFREFTIYHFKYPETEVFEDSYRPLPPPFEGESSCCAAIFPFQFLCTLQCASPLLWEREDRVQRWLLHQAQQRLGPIGRVHGHWSRDYCLECQIELCRLPEMTIAFLAFGCNN